MQALLPHAGRELDHEVRMGDGGVRVRWPIAFRRILTGLTVHVIQPLGAVVVGRQFVVTDRPRRRRAVHMFERAKVLAPQPEQRAAPELAVAAHVVVRIRDELLALHVHPAFTGAVPEFAPHHIRVAIAVFLWDVVAAFKDEDARVMARQFVRDRSAACAAADDDDVELVRRAGHGTIVPGGAGPRPTRSRGTDES